MIADFHFIRPWWLLALVPAILLAWRLWRINPRLDSWAAVCDGHLLQYLVQSKSSGKRQGALLCLFFSLLFFIISLAGPSWTRLPVPSYQQIEPRVLILDMSEAMAANDLSPDRLTRAKFKLHDLLSRKDIGQVGLVVYTSEPFVVSPLTEDGKTIDALLSSLTMDAMPVNGEQLDTALKQGAALIRQAGFKQGQLLVMTAETPSQSAIEEAGRLAKTAIYTSVMPILADQSRNVLFKSLAAAGQGMVLPFNDNETNLKAWLSASTGMHQYSLSEQNQIPVWRDEGRWFLIPAMIGLLPVFRRGWLQRIDT